MARAKPIDIWALPLHKQALAQETFRHEIRIRDLKKIEGMLVLLEAEHAVIKAAGYNISGVEIESAAQKGFIRFAPHALFDGVARAYRALLAAGFKEIKREEGVYAYVYLQKGRLKIKMGLSTHDLSRYCPQCGREAEGGGMTPDQAVIRQAAATNCNANLLRELQHAHVIIRNALQIMSVTQKSVWGERNARDGVDGEGITRANERAAVIGQAVNCPA